MASEDSQHLGRLPKVHRLADLRDLDEPRGAQVFATIHTSDDVGELVEVVSLRRSQRVRLEERNDHIAQVGEPTYDEAIQILSMIVVPAVDVDASAAEERHHPFE